MGILPFIREHPWYWLFATVWLGILYITYIVSTDDRFSPEDQPTMGGITFCCSSTILLAFYACLYGTILAYHYIPRLCQYIKQCLFSQDAHSIAIEPSSTDNPFPLRPRTQALLEEHVGSRLFTRATSSRPSALSTWTRNQTFTFFDASTMAASYQSTTNPVITRSQPLRATITNPPTTTGHYQDRRLRVVGLSAFVSSSEYSFQPAYPCINHADTSVCVYPLQNGGMVYVAKQKFSAGNMRESSKSHWSNCGSAPSTVARSGRNRCRSQNVQSTIRLKLGVATVPLDTCPSFIVARTIATGAANPIQTKDTPPSPAYPPTPPSTRAASPPHQWPTDDNPDKPPPGVCATPRPLAGASGTATNSQAYNNEHESQGQWANMAKLARVVILRLNPRQHRNHSRMVAKRRRMSFAQRVSAVNESVHVALGNWWRQFAGLFPLRTLTDGNNDDDGRIDGPEEYEPSDDESDYESSDDDSDSEWSYSSSDYDETNAGNDYGPMDVDGEEYANWIPSHMQNNSSNVQEPANKTFAPCAGITHCENVERECPELAFREIIRAADELNQQVMNLEYLEFAERRFNYLASNWVHRALNSEVARHTIDEMRGILLYMHLLMG